MLLSEFKVIMRTHVDVSIAPVFYSLSRPTLTLCLDLFKDFFQEPSKRRLKETKILFMSSFKKKMPDRNKKL